MAVNDRPHIGAVLHNLQVQQDLTRALTLAGDLLAFEVDGAEVVGRHEALADHRRAAEDFVLAHAIRDIAIVGRGEALRVDAPPDFADLLFDLAVVDSGVPLAGHLSVPSFYSPARRRTKSFTAFQIQVCREWRSCRRRSV